MGGASRSARRARPTLCPPPDAAANARRCADLPLIDNTDTSLRSHLRAGGGPLVVIDALLGLGQTRDGTALLAPWTQAASERPPRALHLVSIDIPTGRATDTGAPLAQTPFPADLVVTFHAEKPVHQMLRNSGVKVVVQDIGLPHGERE